MSDLMDLRELAAYLRLDRQTIYNWLHQRKLTGIKMGGVWRFSRHAIDRWLQEHTIPAAVANSTDTAGPPMRKGAFNRARRPRTGVATARRTFATTSTSAGAMHATKRTSS